MTKSEMLERISSYELTEWAAYEMKNGPLGSQWRDDMTASIHELLQANNYLTGASGGKKNPVPKPKAVPRPWELNKPAPRPKREDVEEE
jgi:hypothetical protein